MTVIQSRALFRGWQSVGQSTLQVWAIAKREIVLNFLSFRIIITCAALTLSLLLSVHLSAVDYEQRLNNWSINRAGQNDPVVGGVVRYELPDGSFFYSTGTGHEAPLRGPQPFSVLVKGLDDELNRSVSVGQRIGFGPRQDENAEAALYNTPDTLLVVKLLVSILALFLSLETVTREKETGALMTLLAYPIRRWELFLGKSLGASVSLIVPFVIAYSLEIIFVRLVHGLVGSRGELLKVAMVFFLSLLYGLVFIHLGILISASATRTRTAVMIALLSWGALVFIFPAISTLSAKLVVPATSYSELTARLYENQQRAIQAELGNRPGGKTIFDVPNAKQVIFQIIESDRRLTDDFIMKTSNQVDQAQRFGVLLPVGALSFGASDLAGTGPLAYRSYLEFLQSGRDMVIDALKRRWDMNPAEGARMLQQVIEDVAMREYQPNQPSESIRSGIKAMISLAAWTCLLGLAALWRIARYDVR